MKYQLLVTVEFVKWSRKLKDREAARQIALRLARVRGGNLGDVSPVGEGVSEFRISYGPGYRIYFIKRGREIILLLCGGDKSSQKQDIMKAKKIAREVKE